MKKMRKPSRHDCLNAWKNSMAASNGMWTEASRDLYLEIITNPMFDPFPLDFPASMLVDIAPQNAITAIKELIALSADVGFKPTVSTDVALTHWSKKLDFVVKNIDFFEANGFCPQYTMQAYGCMIASKNLYLNDFLVQAVALEPKRFFSIFRGAVMCSNISLLQSLPDELFVTGVRNVSELFYFGMGAAAMKVVYQKVPEDKRPQLFDAIKSQIELSLLNCKSFPKASQLGWNKLDEFVEDITEFANIVTEKELRLLNHLLHVKGFPQLPQFLALQLTDRIEKHLKTVETNDVLLDKETATTSRKRKM